MHRQAHGGQTNKDKDKQRIKKMKEIDIQTMSEQAIREAFREAYDSAPSPLQVSPRTPAVAKVLNTDVRGKNWVVHAKSAGFRFVVYHGHTGFVYSIEPLGATYYYL